MDIQLEQSQDNNLLLDIDKCVLERRIDNKILLFIYICNQIDEHTKREVVILYEEKEVSIEDLERACMSLIVSIDFNNWSDLHKIMTSNNEEARIYLDREKNETDEYILDEERYKESKEIELKIVSILGKLKLFVKKSGLMTTADFHV